ncbi:MAG: PLP-dependent cysteine synthase family protein [Candidatus Bathyarchaeia archaeon]|jgi:cysteine synthase
MIVANNVLDLIGKTPMVRINNLTGPNDASIYAKLEWFNIGGSVKDRLALYVIEYAEAAGRLNREQRILEATSGNTGIALAMIAAAKKYKLTIVMPESVSIERRRLIRAYGAELILSPAAKGTAGAIELKQQMLKGEPEKYIDVDQFKDPANILAHYETTGKEILEQTHAQLDMIVLGIGTAGTGVGTSMRIREVKPEVKIIGVTPKLGTAIQGLRNPGEPFPTQLFRSEWFDEVIEISDAEKTTTFQVARDVAKQEGLFIGMSSGAIMHVALRKAKELGKGRTIVAILPSSGERYLSTPLYPE